MLSPKQYLLNLRIEHAKAFLEGTIQTCEDIAYASGFADACYFSRIFKEKVNCSPLEYRTLFDKQLFYRMKREDN